MKLIDLAVPVLAVGFAANARATPAEADFNGDGYADLAVGAPQEDFGVTNAGVVHVFYGGPAGLSTAGTQLFAEGSGGVLETGEANDFFGSGLAAGDFNGDGFSDLAIGARGEQPTGAVVVLYGSLGGLSSAGNQLFTQSSLGIPAASAAGNWGKTLAAGDFDNDGNEDLAVGGTDGGVAGGGAVNVIPGSPDGLTSGGATVWNQNSPGVLDAAENDDRFAESLASADFDADGYDDLAVGVPRETLGAAMWAGAVNVLYGSPLGITSTGDQFWSQDSAAIIGVADNNDFFGAGLATGDFNGDGYGDLAVSATGDSFAHVILGSTRGLTSAGNVIHLRSGKRVGAGDFNGDGYTDLAHNAPETALFLGPVAVGYGGPTVLHGFETWNQNTPGLLDTEEVGDFFGASLGAGDFDGDGFSDLVVGVVFEDIGAISNAGAINVIYGSASGLAAAGNQFWHQNVAGVPGGAEADDLFGNAVSTSRR